MLKEEYKKFKNFVFDLDGTVWYWDELVQGAKEGIDFLRDNGKEVYFLTNNSMLFPSGFKERLDMLGIDTEISRIICPADFIVSYLREKGAKKVFSVSLDTMETYIKKNGFEISDDPDYVVVTFSSSDEPKVDIAAKIMKKGIPAITNATGKKWVLKGKVLPGTGVIVEKIENLSGSKIEVVGKPSDFAVRYVKDNFNFKPDETIYFGDSLNSDMLFARKSGWSFCFVLTGEYKMEDLDDIEEKPDFIINNIKEILK